MDFKQELQKRGAREFQIVALSPDEDRALAAIAEAERRGVDSVIPYALTLYDDPSWQPRGPRLKPPQLTNQAVETRCAACGGDRFVLVTDGLGMYEETYAPCARCNAECNTSFYRVNGTLARTAAA